MIGMGAANVAAGLFQGFAVSTSGSRTAVAEQSGAKSQLTGLVGAGAGRGPAAVPQLAARRPAADGARRRRHRRGALADGPRASCGATGGSAQSAFVLSLVATAGVMFFGVLEGIVVADRAVDPAVLPAQLVAARRGARPGRRRRGLAQASRRSPTPSRCPASSCTGGRRRCSSPTPARSASRSASSSASSRPRWVVLQCEAITDIDVTAAEMLEQLDRELNEQGVHLAFVRDAQPAAGPRPALRALRHPRPRPLLPDHRAALADIAPAGPGGAADRATGEPGVG